MNQRHVVLLLGALLPAVGVHADELSAADRKFVAMVNQGGMFEIKAGVVAANQGGTQGIKDEGTTEMHDHTVVGEKLKALATANGVQLEDSLNADFEQKLDDLKPLSGPAFDAAYVKAMKDIHAKDGAAFAKEAKSGDNKDLRDFASETHQIVLRHIGLLHTP